MRLDPWKSDFDESGGASAAATHNPVRGAKRGDLAAQGVPPPGGPGLPASRGASLNSGRIDFGEQVPIWLAALIAASCQASANGSYRAIDWYCVSGRAVYTNCGMEAETIQPLGIQLNQGDTLAVSWIPGQTEYTFEIVPRGEYCT